MSSPDLTGFLASGQPRSGRELCDPIDCRQVSTTETMAARAARLPRCRYRFDSFFYGKICITGRNWLHVGSERAGPRVAASCRRWRRVDDTRYRFASTSAACPVAHTNERDFMRTPGTEWNTGSAY